MQLVLVIVVLALTGLIALVVVMAVVRKTPPMRLVLALGLVLIAALALGSGNPQMFEKIIDAFVSTFSG